MIAVPVLAGYKLMSSRLPASGKEIRRLQAPGFVNGIRWSPEGKTIAVRSNGDKTLLWDGLTQPSKNNLVHFVSVPSRRSDGLDET